MLANYLKDLPFSDKRYLKEALQDGFADGEIELNTLRFTYDEDRDLVTVHGLLRGEGIDGEQLFLADFVEVVNNVLANIPVYKTEAEEAEALYQYLQTLSADDQQTLRRRLPEIQRGEKVILAPLEFLYDAGGDTVRIDLRMTTSRYETRDELFLAWMVFVGVVGAV